jgi:stage V sporulation protein S
MTVIKVASESRTAGVAGAIAGMIREKRRSEAQAVGAAAVNQLVKAVILANEFLRAEEIQVACVPEYVDISEEGKKRSAVKFVIGICSIEDESAEM